MSSLNGNAETQTSRDGRRITSGPAGRVTKQSRMKEKEAGERAASLQENEEERRRKNGEGAGEMREGGAPRLQAQQASINSPGSTVE